MPINHPSEPKYEGYREAVRLHTETEVITLSASGIYPPEVQLGFRLTAITPEAVDATETYWQHTVLPWRRIVGQNKPYVRRFEVAMWIGEALVGMAVGRPSRGRDNLTLQYLERDRGANAFPTMKGYVADIAFTAAENYATVIGRDWLKLRGPIPQAVPLYTKLGFTTVERIDGVDFLKRRV